MNYFTNSGNVALAPIGASAHQFNFSRCESIGEARELAKEYLVGAGLADPSAEMPNEAWEECLPVWEEELWLRGASS